jgi:hypothetical protein
MSGDAQRKIPMWLGLFWFGVLALFALSGLCTIFVAVVTAAQAWQEYAEETWPEVTARVENCRLHQTSTRKRDRYYIDCILGYEIGLELNEAHVYSVGRVQWPSTGPLQDWIDAHPVEDCTDAALHAGRRPAHGQQCKAVNCVRRKFFSAFGDRAHAVADAPQWEFCWPTLRHWHRTRNQKLK